MEPNLSDEVARSVSDRMAVAEYALQVAVDRREELLRHLRNGWNYSMVVSPVGRIFRSDELIPADHVTEVQEVRPSSQDALDAIEIVREMIASGDGNRDENSWARAYWAFDINSQMYRIRVGDYAAAVPSNRIRFPLATVVYESEPTMPAIKKPAKADPLVDQHCLHYCSCWVSDKQWPKKKDLGYIFQCLKCGGQIHGVYRGSGENVASGWINQSAAKAMGIEELADVFVPTQKHPYDPETMLQWVRVEIPEQDVTPF